MVVANKRWDGALLENAFKPYRTISGVRASDWRRRYASWMCTFFQSCFMELRHGHSPPCLSMHVSMFEKAFTHLAPPARHQHRSVKANQPDTALHSSVPQTSLQTCCQVRCVDRPFESTARSYFRRRRWVEENIRNRTRTRARTRRTKEGQRQEKKNNNYTMSQKTGHTIVTIARGILLDFR